MKQGFFAIAFLLGCSHFLMAQSCLYATNNNAKDSAKPGTTGYFCDKCNGSYPGGSLQGTFVVNNSGVSQISVTLPGGCGNFAPMTLGAFQVTLGINDKLILDPTVVADAGAINFTLSGPSSTTEGQAEFVYRGDTYTTKGGPTNNLQAAQDRIRSEARALPVSLIDWFATSRASTVSLSWTTSTETDNDYFLLERSADGESFAEVARVPGKGHTDGVIGYEYTDATAPAGMNFYRLSQFDYDGTRTTYGVLSVMVHASAESAPYPNPARAGGRVSFLTPVATEVVLHTLTGREVGRFPGAGPIELPANLPAGVYVLQVGSAFSRLVVR